jgi:Skp family chaperone for outer membrane proteins
VKKGSARYALLISEMNSRLKTACVTVAQTESRDCVVRKGDISDAGGLTVTDLTSDVIAELGR